jgi:predicted nucleic acid-binding protein
MTVIVDASVAMKWVVDEPASASARRLISDELLAAPDLLFIECANVLNTKVRKRAISGLHAREALAAIESVPIRSVPIRPYVAAAHAIAAELGQTAYDSLYLAVALTERSTLLTADEKFVSAAHAHPIYGQAVTLLT